MQPLLLVMPALVAGIHALLNNPDSKTWMAWTSPAMTHTPYDL
jgi:hypothetical protein